MSALLASLLFVASQTAETCPVVTPWREIIPADARATRNVISVRSGQWQWNGDPAKPSDIDRYIGQASRIVDDFWIVIDTQNMPCDDLARLTRTISSRIDCSSGRCFALAVPDELLLPVTPPAPPAPPRRN